MPSFVFEMSGDTASGIAASSSPSALSCMRRRRGFAIAVRGAGCDTKKSDATRKGQISAGVSGKLRSWLDISRAKFETQSSASPRSPPPIPEARSFGTVAFQLRPPLRLPHVAPPSRPTPGTFLSDDMQRRTSNGTWTGTPDALDASRAVLAVLCSAGVSNAQAPRSPRDRT